MLIKNTGVIFGIFLIVFLGFVTIMNLGGAYRRHTELPNYGPAPSFSLTDESGNPWSSDRLKDKVWINDFFFTSCPGPCPALTARLSQIARMFSHREDLHFVSISIDPEDTPEKLKGYADRFRIDLRRWTFLRGDEEHVRDLSTKGFRIAVPDDIGMHSLRVVLVDAENQIRGFYLVDDTESAQKLVQDIDALLNEQRK